jgi:hypothetical protein
VVSCWCETAWKIRCASYLCVTALNVVVLRTTILVTSPKELGLLPYSVNPRQSGTNVGWVDSIVIFCHFGDNKSARFRLAGTPMARNVSRALSASGADS